MQTHLLKAQVVVVERDRYRLDTDQGLIMGQVSGRFHYMHPLKEEFPQVGDYVNYYLADDSLAIIVSVDERKTILDRVDVGQTQERQILATNIDMVMVCMSTNKDFNLRKLNNFLLLAAKPGIKTLVLLTKRDLTDAVDDYINQVKEVTDCEILSVSVYIEEDMAVLRKRIHHHTLVLLGASGVGKSTLINQLLGQDKLKTSDIRVSDAQGRHTTVHRELIRMNATTAIIDTPGIRIAGTYHVPEESFEDILSLSEGCQFSDCLHKQEPGCMVKKAIDEGLLDQERYKLYQKTLKRNAYFEQRHARKYKQK
jgi:ribosome biogenesis GTPase